MSREREGLWNVASSASLDESCNITCRKVNIGKNVRIGPNVAIDGDELTIHDGAIIEEGCSIRSDKIVLGYGTHIESESQLCSIGGGRSKSISIGDYTYIGTHSKILVESLEIGDYCSIYDYFFLSGYKPCSIGHNCWIGRDVILNSTERLTIGNSVGIGAQSQVWSHVVFGELLEGCLVEKWEPTRLEDEAWIVGGHVVVSPGVTVARRSVILPGSVVTKDTLPGRTYAGTPAVDISEKVRAYRDVTLDEKYEMIGKFLDEFVNSLPESWSVEKVEGGYNLRSDNYNAFVLVVEKPEDCTVGDGADVAIFSKVASEMNLGKHITVFNLETKFYTKRRTRIEVMLMKFLKNFRAKFIPL